MNDKDKLENIAEKRWEEGYEDGYKGGWEDAKAEIIRCMHLVELCDYQKGNSLMKIYIVKEKRFPEINEKVFKHKIDAEEYIASCEDTNEIEEHEVIE